MTRVGNPALTAFMKQSSAGSMTETNG
jgi:hypothetical protein